jgi:hypothetical protein
MDAEGSEREKPETGISEAAREDRGQAEREVAERHQEATSPDPHHELSNPAVDPDPTEYPDPYERRRDPRDPDAVDTPASPGRAERREEGAAPRGPSTSDPPPPRNIDRARGGEGEGA